MITWSDLGDSLWLTGFLFAVSLLLFLPPYFVALLWIRIFIKTNPGRRILSAGLISGLPLGLTGITAGFLTGASRVSAVTALVPAVLTFMGLMVVYLIGKGPLRAAIAGFAVFIFSVSLLVGTSLGSASREQHEKVISSLQVQENEATQELAIRRFRGLLGLPLDTPKPNAEISQP